MTMEGHIMVDAHEQQEGFKKLTDGIMGAASQVDETLATTAGITKYNPATKLIKVKGGALYLQVKDRIVWLRTEHPTSKITTQLLQYVPAHEMYIVHARVELPDGSVGEGLAQETLEDFKAGPLEKAETKAIGRALAALGFGTQWALELEEQDTYADSPVKPNDPISIIGRRSAAGVEALREEVIAALERDTDAKQRLPKAAGEMSEEELSKCIVWLRQRAIADAGVSR